MSSFSPTVPLSSDNAYGFTMNETIKSLIRQNFISLLLTVPGERVMNPAFGVGMKRFLFEPFGAGTYADIENRIKAQVAAYIPAILIRKISFNGMNRDKNLLGMTIVYSIKGLGMSDSLTI